MNAVSQLCIDVTYILNSGFLVRVNDILLVFDDFDDPSGTVLEAVKKNDYARLYFFCSHSHFDHFSPHIMQFTNEVSFYILSEDIKQLPSAGRMPPDKTIWMPVYDSWKDDFIQVTSFSSTDEGTSFLVEAADRKIFHAGDFNWWDWLGDTAENRKLAENAFRKQMKHLAGLSFDVAFFPVDGRLEDSMARGAEVFCKETDTHALVTMHSVGYPVWRPPSDFFALGHKIPVWSPRTPGEQHSF